MANGDSGSVIVAGTGPAGLIAALALAHAGFSVSLLGPVPRTDDRRTTALMMPSLSFLDELGVREALVAGAAPLKTMRIVDATRRLVRSLPVTFRASEIGEEAFGHNIPNTVLNRELQAAVERAENIAWQRDMVAGWQIDAENVTANLDDGSAVAAQLAVAADGRGSAAREAAGIRAVRHSYRQTALVLNFAHERDHGFCSTEFHTETGPFTQVPLPGRRSSLVWVVRPEEAERLEALSDAEISLLIEEKMQSMLGRVTAEPGRQTYPLSAALPSRFARNRVALVGESAHVFPPIGAQGLNLGIRDVRDLVATAERFRGDPGSERALSDYSARRRPDIVARAGAVNALNASLLSGFLPAQLARSAGLGLLSALAPLRAFFMREGMEPGSGFRQAATSTREQVRRQRA
ncbi:UbiH/UbiF family hydroxylase [Nitratireductor mangrovi]|uniref:UbiH/UbiF family hydroxylase n=1 Tax=Nitratireductor mangrovi TaxID=2599600 RepID=A0A5B8L325_9HYPH|nr:UbiH/UbiF family hydroxylase [Nitratireductor mangrovi]QDZ02397.1 UbiH/UbiF family hydroxylase [Nitratireductor mangrovi]